MKTSIFIPKRLNVGFRNRSDTYTGRLAYVIYYDEKNKLRKEKSWEGWRDSSIPNEEFDNEPISGFVLNKKVGDYSSGWDHRQAYCRVYDPRNFEFEITIENLLYILENTSSIKGKGLEGEFVYGWSGTELILIPVCSPDYKAITEYTKTIQTNSTVKAKDLILGALYEDKDGYQYVYMGKHETFESAYKFAENGEEKIVNKYSKIPYNRSYSKVDYTNTTVSVGEKLWFVNRYTKTRYTGNSYVDVPGEYNYNYETYRSVPKKIIKCVQTTCVDDYDVILENMQGLDTFSPPDEDRREFVPYDFDTFKKLITGKREYRHYNVFYDGVFSDGMIRYKLDIDKDNKVRIDLETSNTDIFNDYKLGVGPTLDESLNDFKSRFGSAVIAKENNGYYGWSSKTYSYYINGLSIEDVFNRLKPGYVQTYLKNGHKYKALLRRYLSELES